MLRRTPEKLIPWAAPRARHDALLEARQQKPRVLGQQQIRGIGDICPVQRLKPGEQRAQRGRRGLRSATQLRADTPVVDPAQPTRLTDESGQSRRESRGRYEI